MANENKETLTETWIRGIKNNPVLATIIILSLSIAGISTFSQSISSLYQLASSYLEDPERNFSSAIKKLESDDAKTRIEAISTLQRLSETSEKYQIKILEALGSFVRSQAPWKKNIFHEHPEKDVQLALTTIAQIPKRDEKGNLYRVDMHNVDISGANLENGNLEGVILWGSNLRNVILSRANLKEADLGGVDFTDASLEMADLEDSKLWPSFLEPNRASIFLRTRFAGANLKNAHLEFAILDNAIDLTQDQLKEAITDQHTRPAREITAPNKDMFPSHR